MKNFIKTLYLLLLITAFFFNIEQASASGFKTYNITGSEIFADNIEISHLYSLDDFLLAKINNKEYYYALYDPKSLKLITRIARKGEGPNEVPNGLSYSCQFFKKDNQLKIWTYGVNTHKLYLINLTQSIKEQKTIIEKKIKISPDINFSNLFYLDSNKIIGNNGMISPNMNRLQIFDPVKKTISKTVPLFPPFKIKENINNMDYIFYRYNVLYISSFKMKPDKTLFSSAMNFFNRIDIFDNLGNLKYSFIDKENNNSNRKINDYLETSEGNIEKIEIKNFYGYSVTTNSFIYTLYRNQLKSEYGKISKPISIRIFNWKAEPVCEINIPDYLTTFTIDEKNGIMYGVAYFDEKILKYDIKDILDEIK